MKIKTIGVLVAAVFALGGQSPAPAPDAGTPHHLVYRFGFNTKVANQGTGTGTTTIDIQGLAPDGGVMISGQDFWWNTVRPRASNTCEVYPSGTVACTKMPYAISPMQLTLFPLLGRSYFAGLSASGKGSWTQTYEVKAAIIPGGTVGFSGQLYTWNAVYNLKGEGLIQGGPLVLVEVNGTLKQQGGRYLAATSSQRIGYDPVAKVPVLVQDLRSHIPQTSVNNKDLVDLKLTKKSQAAVQQQ